ncbi:hypothetical protein I350_00895 [Cryptococcus amylolentus CBS 6273]|uniref:Major facilitator superfamily (MFS) profile domain-containing protein n=1 Tax=Cryptococcus amylolentus CBS 6273 TaxID=1296118 RepID=A0A1E3KGA6_9TREE|nr:hypothetical protein I350_00895 [Cryptococcus amylolentus CBS 6273]
MTKKLDGAAGQVSTEGRTLPWGARWRNSAWYITLVVTFGVAIDTLVYAIVVPVLPYRLQSLNYSNISSLTSWLLFAYSAGIFTCTLPVSYFFHRYPYRRAPLIGAVFTMMLALLLFMLAEPYWCMVLSRFVQGAASTVVWCLGFALICENVKEENVGRQLGYAMAGLSMGQSIAPPIGGALYQHLGWKAPLIFCEILCFIDLVLRLFILENTTIRQFHEERFNLPPGSLKPTIVDGQVVMPDNPGIEDTSCMALTEAEKETMMGEGLKPGHVVGALCKSPRGITAFMSMFVFGIITGLLEPTLTLRVQELWDKNSGFVGLVYLAAAAPTFFAGPIVGACSDRFGAEFIMLPCMILVLPWVPLMLLTGSLPGFIIFFALVNLLTTCAMNPAGLEVTMVARDIKGLSEIHQFGALQIAFAISTAVGTIIGGQFYDRIPNGWSAVIWFAFGIAVAVLPLIFFFSGNRPLVKRVFGKGGKRGDGEEERASGDRLREEKGSLAGLEV